MKKPQVLFAIGEVEWKYTYGKLRHLVSMAAATGQWEVSVASHSKEICAAFSDSPIKSFHLEEEIVRHLPEHAISMTDLMIRLIQDIDFPGSRLPLWKTIAMDDYMGCLSLHKRPPLPIRPDVLVYPLIGIDNTTADSSHFYGGMALEAKKAAATVIGVEISPLGNRQTFAASLADYYAVKSEFSRSFVESQELASPGQSFILPPEEVYLLSCRQDSVLDEYFQQAVALKAKIRMLGGSTVIFIPHNVAFIYETREILKALKLLKYPVAVVLNVDPNVARHSLKEKEMVEKVYRKELADLPCVIINEEPGWLWTLLYGDIVWGAACSVYAEISSFYDKLTIISQRFGQKAWVGEHLVMEPEPERAIPMIESWIERRLLRRKSLNGIISHILTTSRDAKPEAAHYGS